MPVLWGGLHKFRKDKKKISDRLHPNLNRSVGGIPLAKKEFLLKIFRSDFFFLFAIFEEPNIFINAYFYPNLILVSYFILFPYLLVGALENIL